MDMTSTSPWTILLRSFNKQHVVQNRLLPEFQVEEPRSNHAWKKAIRGTSGCILEHTWTVCGLDNGVALVITLVEVKVRRKSIGG